LSNNQEKCVEFTDEIPCKHERPATYIPKEHAPTFSISPSSH
jgi:hypothetical protein